MADYDAIVVGAGPTGLMMSGFLAKEGKKVLCLDMNDHFGGLASNVEVWPGYTHNTGAWFMMFGQLKFLWDTFELDKYGVELLDPPTVGLILSNGGQPCLKMFSDNDQQMNYIRESYGEKALKGFTDFLQFFGPMSSSMVQAMGNLPMSMAELMDKMPSIEGKDALRQIFYGPIMNILDRFLPQCKENDPLRGWVACMTPDGFEGGMMTPGSALTIAYHLGAPSETGGGAQFKLPRGHMGAFSNGLAASCKEKGVEFRLNTEIKKFVIKKGKCVGVELMNGEVISADDTISSLDTNNTFNRCMDPADLPSKFFQKQVSQISYKDHFVQEYVRLNKLPTFGGEYEYLNEGDWRWLAWHYPTAEIVEESWDAIKLGRIPQEIVPAYYIPSVIDPSLAPEGEHSMTLFTHLCWPYGIKPEQYEATGEEIHRKTVETYERYMPDFGSCIDDYKVMTMPEYEKKYHVTGGTWTHGMISIDQMFNFRPMVGMSNYKAPFDNFYLCGTSNHPGPGITGFQPINCLNVMKQDWKKK